MPRRWSLSPQRPLRPFCIGTDTKNVEGGLAENPRTTARRPPSPRRLPSVSNLPPIKYHGFPSLPFPLLPTSRPRPEIGSRARVSHFATAPSFAPTRFGRACRSSVAIPAQALTRRRPPDDAPRPSVPLCRGPSRPVSHLPSVHLVTILRIFSSPNTLRRTGLRRRRTGRLAI